MPLPFRPSGALLGFASTLACAGLAYAQPIDMDRLAAALAAGPAGPLLQEVSYGELDIAPLADGSTVRATLFDVQIAGQDLDRLDFAVRRIDADRFALSDFTLPPRLLFEDASLGYGLTWDQFTFSGLYDFAALAYEDIEIDIRGLNLQGTGADLEFELASLTGQVQVSSDDNSLRSSFAGEGLRLGLIDAGAPIDLTAPGFRLRSAGSGSVTEQNPISHLVQQFGSRLAMLLLPESTGRTSAPIIGDQATLTLQFDGLDVTRGGPAPVILTLGPVTLVAVAQGQTTPGAGRAHYTYVVEGATFRTPDRQTTVSAGSLSGIYLLDGMDFSQDSPLLGSALYEEGPDYGPLADMIPALGLISGRLTLKDLSVPGLIGEETVDLDRLELALSADARGDLGEIGLTLGLDGVDLGATQGPLFTDLLPRTVDVSLNMTNLDLALLEALFRTAVRSGPISDERALERDMRRLIPDLLTWWQESQVVLNPSLAYTAKAANLEAEGALLFDNGATYGLVGKTEFRLGDYEALLQRLAARQEDRSPEEQDFVQAFLPSLSSLGGLGDLQEDGTLVVDLAIGRSGSISVNGLPLTF